MDIARGAVSADRFIDIGGAKVEQAMKRSTVEFLASVKNETDPRDVARCFKIPGASSISVSEAVKVYIASKATRTLKALINKVIQLML